MCARNILIDKRLCNPEKNFAEIVGRRGRGHPDNICDMIAERLSEYYCKYCEQDLKIKVPQHNFDKVQISGGEVKWEKTFLKYPNEPPVGIQLKPMTIQIAGRAVNKIDKFEIDLKEIVKKAVNDVFNETFQRINPNDDEQIDRIINVNEGSESLRKLYQLRRAGDTNIGISHWPLTSFEKFVLNSEIEIEEKLIDNLNFIGEDIKILAIRNCNNIKVILTIAMIANEFNNLNDYIEKKNYLKHKTFEVIGNNLWKDDLILDIEINPSDDLKVSSKAYGNAFLTISGTSAENGDDGATGRGNPIEGVISSYQMTTGSNAIYGKNPFNHPSKLYNILSFIISKNIVDFISEIKSCSIVLVSKIGVTLNSPQFINVSIEVENKISKRIENQINSIILKHLKNIDLIEPFILANRINDIPKLLKYNKIDFDIFLK